MSDRAIFDAFLADLDLPDIEPTQMFGVACARRVGGKPVLSWFNGDMVFKLGAPRVQALLQSHAECRPFDPSGKNRPFKDWIQVPESAGLDWDSLAREALGF